MSIPNLPTDFKDDILNTDVNIDRKYHQMYNSDDSVSMSDVTSYLQRGTVFGAAEVNQIHSAINNIYSERILNLNELNLVTETGFFVDALAVKDVNNSMTLNTFASIDGSSFNKNFLQVSLTTANATYNKTACFLKYANESGWNNVPTEMVDKNWMGVRNVYRRSSTHVLVTILESFPIPGRMWSNLYDGSNWSGWNIISPVPRIISGTRVINGMTGGTSAVLFTLSQLQTAFNASSASRDCFAVSVTNGDSDASNAHFDGTTWLNNDLYVLFSGNEFGAARINYIVAYNPNGDDPIS